MTYDLIVIGSGPGGYVAAIRAAQLGLKVACIEKDKSLGGTCLNVGCIPSKALLHSSELYWKLEHDYAAHGIQVEKAAVNFSTLMHRKEEIVKGFNLGIESLFKKNKIERFMGHARLSGIHTVDVDGKKIEGKHVLLATGSEPTSLPFLPFDEQKVLSSTGALALRVVPKKLLIIGAGIIGVELGSVYRRLGSEVVFIEFFDRICPTFDFSISQALKQSLIGQGMEFHLSHQVTSACVGSQVELIAKRGASEVQFQGDAVLVAIGRKPFTRSLGLDVVGISPDPKGFIPIDASFRTQVPSIFAIGDLVNGPMLAHKASEEGVAVAELIAGKRPTIEYAAIPSVAYTSPEVAAVGFTEEELKTKKVSYKVGQFSFKANSRARCTGEMEGFVKVLIEKTTQQLLGVHIIGPHASELIAEASLAMRLRLNALEIADSCHAHPTLSESLKEATLAATKGAIHS